VKRAYLVAATALLAGCNVVLGIDEPSDRLLASGPVDAGSFIKDGAAPPDDDPADGADASLELPEPGPYARAAWPMPTSAKEGLPHRASYVVEPPGVVRDQITLLIWQQGREREPVSLSEARTYCAGLSLAGGRFRLPSRIELASLLDLEQSPPALDHDAFPEAVAGSYWTSSVYAGNDRRNWLVNFGFGTALLLVGEDSEKNLVRCVKSPETDAAPATRELVVAEDTVSDPATRLTWRRGALPAMTTVEEAAAACAALPSEQGAFRLPTIKELHTLVDERRIKTAIDPLAFPDTASSYFWTSSAVMGFPQYAWMVSFTDGSDRWVPAETTGDTRCVRSTPEVSK